MMTAAAAAAAAAGPGEQHVVRCAWFPVSVDLSPPP